MTLSIGSIAPDFTAETTQGTIHFPDWIGDGWAILFSHPKAFTPVCTTELGYMAGLEDEFARRNTKIIGLSVDSSDDNNRWLPDIEDVSGNAVDIPALNGLPLLGRQEPGGITEQAVRRLMQLQGTMAPAQIISLLDFGANTLALGDHADHIHVGFQPMFGENRKLGMQALAVLEPGQWSDLIARLREIDNPVVPTEPSEYALPAKPKRASDAHVGE